MRSLILSFVMVTAASATTSAQAVQTLDRSPSPQYFAPSAEGVSALGHLLSAPPGQVDVAEALQRSTLTVPRPIEREGTVTGAVTDAQTGEPISAAQVFIRALDVGVLSTEDGRYLLLNVPDGTHTLTAELIGYEPVSAVVTVTPGSTVIQDFRLTSQAVSLDAIVVTGVPGGTRRRAIGNAVGTLDGTAVTSVAPVGDVQDVLRGRSPSVNMMGSGMVGAAPRIRIRGASTFSLSGNPLVYIDGVRSNNEEITGFTFGNNSGVRSALGSLDPEQIERIEVLKGPAAATLYGTEASRGVINIITKRGQSGGAQVDVMVRQGVNYTANPGENIAYENYWTHPTTGTTSSVNIIDYQDGKGNDVFTNGHVQSYSAAVSGGSQDTRYFLSGTYSDEVGVLSHNWAKRLNLRTNLDTQLSETIGAALSMGYTNSDDRLPSDGFSSIVEGVQFGNPSWLPENRCDTNPSAGCDTFDGFVRQGTPARDRSLFNHQNLDRFTGSLQLDHTVGDWLTTRLTTGLDYTGEVNVAFREFQTNDTTIAALGSTASRGFRNESRWTRFYTTTDFSSTAEFDLTETIASSSSVGIQYYTRTASFLASSGQQFAGPGLSTVTSTSIQNVPQNNNIEDNTLGLYVQETLAWQDRLFLTGAVRVDNNSAFGNDIDLVTYPKASLSWVINEEPWFQDASPDWLSSLRLRAAWGKSGEQPAAFSALRTWSAVTGPQNSSGVTPNTVGNAELTAEVGRETELGFDARFLESRAGLQFTYYDKLTEGAILERDLPPSLGFTGEQFVNAGKIVNEGVEAQLDAQILDTPSFGWDVNFGFSWNTAEILQLSGEPGDTTIVFNSWSSMEHRVGHAPYSWFGVKVISADIDPTDGSVTNALCSDGLGGSTACFDSGGTTIAPRVELGRAIAPVEWSLNSTFSFGANLSLHTLFTAERGHKRFDNTNRQRCRLYRVCRVNHFPEEADDARLMTTIQSSDQIIDAWVNDVSFVRLKEISLTYELPQSFVQGFGMSRATAQIAGSNLLTFTDWTDSDPENQFSSGGRAFMQQNNLPFPQQITTSIRFSF